MATDGKAGIVATTEIPEAYLLACIGFCFSERLSQGTNRKKDGQLAK